MKFSPRLCASVAIFLFLFYRNAPAQELFIRTFTTHDSVMLRWVPSNIETWKLGNKNGYLIERFLQADFPNGNSTLISSSPISPLQKTDSIWNKLIREDKLNAFVFESLYPEKTVATNSQKQKIEEQTKLGFVLKAADLSVNTAKAEGLYFCDKTISPNQVYVYRISIANIPTNQKQISATAIIDGKLSVLNSSTNIRGDFRNKKVAITFDVSSTREEFAGYIIERSEDSLHFTRINSTLLTFAKSQYEINKTELVYQDSFPQNHKTYWYRVRGYSYFGIIGPPSPSIHGKGKEEWNIYPIVDTLFSTDNQKVEMKFHLSDKIDSSQLKSFIIMRATKSDGVYSSITKTPLSKNNFSFTDYKPAFANYYLVIAISAENDSGFSFPYFFELKDDVPPPVPENLIGKIDTNGIVKLTWSKVAAPDLKGYRVFRCNSLTEEFSEVSDSVLSENNFSDTITIQTLTPRVYYSVRSVDKLYNNSKNSQPCLLKRPDKIPPVAPVVKYIIHSDSSIQLGWINSSSDDVQCVELFRKNNLNQIFQSASWTGKDTLQHFSDFLASPGIDYNYSLLVTDSSGNKSQTDFPTIHFQPRIYPALKNISAIPDFEKRIVTLSWNAPDEKVDRYIIYKSKKGESLRTWKTLDGNTTSVIDKELYPGNMYEYEVKAVLKNGAETKMTRVEVTF